MEKFFKKTILCIFGLFIIYMALSLLIGFHNTNMIIKSAIDGIKSWF